MMAISKFDLRILAAIHRLGGKACAVPLRDKLRGMWFRPSAGRLYVALYKLESMGILSSTWVEGNYPRHRLYQIEGVDVVADEIKRLLDAIPLPETEPFPGETLIADGWVYRDIPSLMLPEYWDMLLTAIGEGHYRVLAMSEITRDGQEWRRGQLLISPTGIENMKAWLAKRRAT